MIIVQLLKSDFSYYDPCNCLDNAVILKSASWCNGHDTSLTFSITV